MALIKCPECGKELSDKARTCVQCGYVLNDDNNTPEQSNTMEQSSTTEKTNATNKKKGVLVIAIACMVLVAAFVVIMLVRSDKSGNTDNSGKSEETTEELTISPEVEGLIKSIDSIGEVSFASQDVIEDLDNKYNALADSDKAQVSNYDKLKSAKESLSKLEEDYNKIKDYIDDADKEFDKFLNYANTSDPMSSYNSNISMMTNVKNMLRDARTVCGDTEAFKTLKNYINTAISDTPTSTVYDNNGLSYELDKHEILAKDFYDIQIELENIKKK